MSIEIQYQEYLAQVAACYGKPMSMKQFIAKNYKVSRRSCKRLSVWLKEIEKYGFTDVSVSQRYLEEDPVVTCGQDWLPNGREIASFRLAFGNYRSQKIGCAMFVPQVVAQ